MRFAILVCLALAVPALSIPMKAAVDDEPDPPRDPSTPAPPPPTKAPPPETKMDPEALIKRHGYPVETLKVETDDGYILNMYRIPKGRNDLSNATRPVVLLLHGFQTSAADWLINSPQESAPFVFADGGFDVYIGNFRGNKYARQHKSWDPSTYMFWQFSIHELATKDLPKMITAALQKSKASDLYLVAHSLGATAAYILLSTPNIINARQIRQLHAIAPVLYSDHVQGPMKYAAPILKDINTASAMFGLGEIKSNPAIEQLLARYACQDPTKDLNCQNLLLMIAGPHTRQIDENQLEIINAHSPSGTSVQNLVHLAQLIAPAASNEAKRPKQFDYGNAYLNNLHYRSPVPPVYNIAQSFLTRTFVYSSECDWIAQVTDVQTAKDLHAAVTISNSIVPSFNHMDFIWGRRAAAEIYRPIMFSMADDALNPKPPQPPPEGK